jgi:hypothetical protein
VISRIGCHGESCQHKSKETEEYCRVRTLHVDVPRLRDVGKTIRTRTENEIKP